MGKDSRIKSVPIPSLSISKGAGIVHQAGYRYGITPDAVILMDNYKKRKLDRDRFLRYAVAEILSRCH